MNKLLISTICAAALASSASAFTLDLSGLNGVNLGAGTITNSYGTFTVVGPGSAFISGGVAHLDNTESFTVIYPSSVTYVGAFTVGNMAINDSGSQVQYTATEDGTSATSLTFNPVPEPSSTALLGLGGLALILRRRK